ncbi:MAG: hypothetical protein MI810_15715 [Flavobacteriales bacterium]|jgi:hypothetical protein|nr:hypothetical protein [Flavobacteriales bacterium]
MKKNTSILLAILTAAFMFSLMGGKEAVKLSATDKYKVIKVDGRIVFQKTSVEMKKGDIFLSGTPLRFTTPQSRAAVISSLKGRYVLSAAEKGQTNILPAANNISSRAGALLNMVDLRNHFTGRYLIVGTMELELGKEAFPMGAENFFYLVYNHNDEQIRKKLSYNGDYLILDKEEIYKIDGQAIPYEEKEMTLFYRKDGQSSKVGTFTPVFADTKELKEEVNIILEEYNEKDTNTKIKEISAYLGEFYGKPQKENLEAWLKIEYDLD